MKWALTGLIWAMIAAFFHYTLPQTDVVRITDTYEKRVDFGLNAPFWANADTGSATGTPNRDIFFIQAIRADGRPMIYRNEDTGWGWPPYFKFNAANLQAQASDLISKKNDADPQWVAVRHYGWRNEFLSIYPNALSIRPVPGPDYRPGFPWFNAVVIGLFLALVWAVWVRWRRFRARRLDPAMEEMTDTLLDARDGLRERLGGLWRRLRRLVGGA